MSEKWSTAFGAHPRSALQAADLVGIAVSNGEGGYVSQPAAGEWGVLTSTTNVIYVSASGNDTTGNGSLLCPYASVSQALSTITPSLSTLTIIKCTGNITEPTSSNCNLLPNVNIIFDGGVWAPYNIGIDSRWTSTSFNYAQSIIQNCLLNPSNSCNFENTDGLFSAALIIFDDVQTLNLSAHSSPIPFTFNVATNNFAFEFKNCDFISYVNNDGNSTFNITNTGSFYFNGGALPANFNQTGSPINPCYIYFNGCGGSPNNLTFANSYIYINNVASFQNETGYWFFIGNCNVYYDTTIMDNNSFVDGLFLNSYTKVSGGSGYTHATVTAPPPDIPGGVQATAIANILSGEILSLTFTNVGSGYLNGFTWTITGDGTGANYTTSNTSPQMLSNNYYFGQVTDQVIIPQYSPSNYTPTTNPIGAAHQTWLYGHLAGIDAALGSTAGNGAPGLIYGLTPKWNSHTQVNVTPGWVSIPDSGTENFISSFYSNQITVDISTNGVNGLDTGSVEANEWYALNAIYGSGQTPAYVFTLLGNSISFPSGYTIGRLIGVVRTDSNPYIMNYVVTGQSNARRYMWNDLQNNNGFIIVNATNTMSATNISCNIGQPPSFNTMISQQVDVEVTYTSSNGSIPSGTAETCGVAPNLGGGVITVDLPRYITATQSQSVFTEDMILINPDNQIRYTINPVGSDYAIQVSIKGFIIEV